MSFVDRLVKASRAVGAGANSADARAAIGRVLAAEVPELLASLERDRGAGAFSLWGWSTVLDENIDAPVIDEPLFASLHEAAGIEATWPIGNAGVLHLYGYLLSMVETPFGLKRERWVGSELETALGMPAGSFMARIAKPDQQPGGLLSFVSRALLEVLDDETAILAVVDEFAGEEREEVARALLVQSTSAPDARAVVYAIRVGPRTQLITAFPVATTPAKWLADVTSEPPRLRYNAAAHELAPKSPLAERRVSRPNLRARGR
ncbi:amino acid deaminase [Subtercola lobariae]|uniref:Amino acid deaminase n=1 Tax=Subtercola lobariae TaxID=1588641 RepID=A0A917B1L1_9MICO|nr:amino acid deaminase [Subtercola lobariae]GGF16830.1 hypothetical protein GCM10011399_08240 [Subtercola lobariae]